MAREITALEPQNIIIDWVDDEAGIFPADANRRRLESFFELCTMLTPDDVAGRRTPADVHITDLNMANEVCRTTACGAPAAGLTAAIIRAVQAPEHPAVIIPYTAFFDLFRDQLALLQLFRPKGVHILWDKVSKHTELPALFEIAVCEYRKAIVAGIESGRVELSVVETERLRDLARQNEHLDGDEHIELFTAEGCRRFRLGSFFYDTADVQDAGGGYEFEASIPSTEVAAWLDLLPAAPAAFREAETLARKFWLVAHSEAAQRIYEGGAENTKAGMPWLLGGEWHDVDEPESCTVVRLAVLFAILLEVAFRRKHSERRDEEVFYETSQSPEDSETRAGTLQERARREEQHAERIQRELDILSGMPGGEADPELHHLGLATVSDFNLVLPLEPGDIVRLMDPLPAGKAVLSLGRDKRYGKALTGKDNSGHFRIGRPLDLLAILSKGDISSLDGTERLCVKRFALQHIASDAGRMTPWLDRVRRG